MWARRPAVHFIYLFMATLGTSMSWDWKLVVVPALVSAGLRFVEELSPLSPVRFRPLFHVVYGVVGAAAGSIVDGRGVTITAHALVAVAIAGALRWLELVKPGAPPAND